MPKARLFQPYSASLYVENNISSVTIVCNPPSDKNISSTAGTFTGNPNATGTSLRTCTATEASPGTRSIIKKFLIIIDP